MSNDQTRTVSPCAFLLGAPAEIGGWLGPAEPVSQAHGRGRNVARVVSGFNGNPLSSRIGEKTGQIGRGGRITPEPPAGNLSRILWLRKVARLNLLPQSGFFRVFPLFNGRCKLYIYKRFRAVGTAKNQ
jgi:hypothetical protein